MDLLNLVTQRCLQMCRETYCQEPIYDHVLYCVPALKTELLDVNEITNILLNEDGRYRPSIRLSADAITEKETVINVSWGNDFMDPDEWTDFDPPKNLRVKFEPFIPMGPPLNDLSAEDLNNFENGRPFTRIKLPQYKR